MKTIGLIGGMSWESTRIYYDAVNVEVRTRLGGLHSAKCIVHSLDFAPIAEMQAAGRWEEAGQVLAGAARDLERGGAEVLGLCTNTMHKVADQVQAAVSIPLLHLADTTAAAVRDAGLTTVGLLATGFTMEQNFYRDRLAGHGLDVLVPDADDRAEVHRIIYDELVRDVLRPEPRDAFRRAMGDLVAEGAEGIVFGCTEVGLLVGPDDTGVPTFDTVALHAAAAVDWMLSPSR